jgi:recombination protein RecA
MSLDIDNLINDAIGENDPQQGVPGWLDTGYPPLNKAISSMWDGGLPMGRMIEIFGPPSCGKTAVATKAMASAQAMGGVAAFMDHETSFDIGLAKDLGLDPTSRWVYKQPTTFEQSIDMVKILAKRLRNVDDKLRPLKGKAPLPMDKPIVVVFDSLASMVPDSKMYDSKGKMKEAGDNTMHDKLALAAATSSHFPLLVQIANKCNICLIFLNQVRTKPGIVYGDATTTPGGNAPEFNASVRIGLTREMIKDKDKNIIGQTVKAFVRKNKVSAPFRKAQWNFMFREDGSGYFDVDGSLVELLADSGILERDGNGYIWTDGKKYMKPALKEKIEKENLRPELLRLLQGVELEEGVLGDTVADFGLEENDHEEGDEE